MGVIQIRGVSDDVHERLKLKAEMEGTSLSEYLRVQLEQLALEPTMGEILDFVASQPPVELDETPAEAIRAEREERERHLDDVIHRRES